MDLVFKYFPDLTETQKLQFNNLYGLYHEWNAKINVISRKDIDHLAERHILHSLGIAKIIQFTPGSKILDVGTGGGLPGIPLAIFFPQVHFHLIDSIGKKIKVVKDITEQLQLENVTSEQARAEGISGKYDFIVSRAVTTLPQFTKWVFPLISNLNINSLPNGILYLKGGDLVNEFLSIVKHCKSFELKDYFGEEFFTTKKIVHIY
jgi:16S rRNA (guanine527-N7)-methyltransferase